MATFLHLFLLLAFTAAQAASAPAADPRLQAVTPFVSPDVFAVVHVDLARANAPEVAGRMLGATSIATGDVVKEGIELGRVAQNAGVKEVFLVFALADMPGDPRYIVVPAEGADVNADVVAQAVLGTGKAPRPGEPTTAAMVNGVVFIGPKAALERARNGPEEARPELSAAWAAAQGGTVDARVLILPSADSRRVLEELVPNFPAELGGGPITDLTRGMIWGAAALNLGAEPSVHVVAESQDEKAARGLEQLVNKTVEFARRDPDVAKRLHDLPALVTDIKPVVAAKRVTVDIEGKKAIALIDAIARPLQASAALTDCINNLKRIGLAIHNYIGKNDDRLFPPAFSQDKAGKPLLSWRVLILADLDQKALFEQFHLDEPWDSPHNRELIAKMPAIYRCPSGKAELARQGKTRYLSPRGAGTIFRGAQPVKITDVTDGTSNTTMVIDAGDDNAVIWTKPDDWDVEPNLNLERVWKAHDGSGSNFLFADGAVRFLTELINPATFKKLLTYAGGEVIAADDLQ